MMRVYTQNKALKRTRVLSFLCAIALFLGSALPALSQTVTGMGSAYNGDGTDAVCTGQMIDYNTGPAFCDTGGTWEIYKEGSTSTALFAQRYLTCLDKSSIKPYAIVSCGGPCTSDPDIGIRNTTGTVGCTDRSVFSPTYVISGTLKVTWKRAGKYKVKYKPSSPWCSVVERYVTVVNSTAISVGYLSGSQNILCSSGGTITYSVPAITGATRYDWNFASTSGAINMSFNGSASTTTIQSSVTANVSTTNGAASGTLTVTARTACGNTSTRSFTITRMTPAGGISGSSSICVGSFGGYTTGYGANHVWRVSSSSFSVHGSGSYATVDAYYEGSALMSVTYNRECDNMLVTESMPIYGINCGYGTMAVAPNPATDEVEISYPETFGEYDVKVYNSFNKVVTSGKLRKGKLRLDVRALPEGMYYVLLTDGKAVRVSGRLMKK